MFKSVDNTSNFHQYELGSITNKYV